MAFRCVAVALVTTVLLFGAAGGTGDSAYRLDASQTSGAYNYAS